MDTTQPRPHWDAELHQATSTALQRFMTLEAPNPQLVYDVIAAVEDWHKAKRSQRVRTHSAQCWRWHSECAEHLIENLQEENARLKEQRERLRQDNTRLLKTNRKLTKTVDRVTHLADSWLSWIQRSDQMGYTSFTVGEAHYSLVRALRRKKHKDAT